ncbi:aminoglycoside phosphotransferase [Actinotalea sp. M2MS4P-6]|uniref:maltokinase N-terminal cap-like domain-containing protein n=1 Tax=Actinotalea sp. M2MS4P-6 TaxID=2983762 RepID=UPI0021E47336|nr:aminoglycoside phosphotransferase [Actinotalea sp. M2MS4P-6]MCV2394063.1 aminoglycoside phosphotransferase [Actinotalea sp. M2MS4P-6]
MSTVPPSVTELLAGWMPAQRWYPAKGRGVGLRPLGTLTLSGPDPDATIEVRVIGLDSGDRFDVVQVPLTYRAAPLPAGEHALVGTTEQHGRTRWVYDGPHDPAYVTALLAALDHPAGRPVPAPSRSRVLRGEQSNTSVIVDVDGSGPLIVKVFRTLHPGDNPDVEVLRGLDGFPQVPAVIGWLGGTWRTPGGDEANGHLAVATEFVADGRDAWREAVAAVEEGRDFSAEAHGLGAATARLHAALADAFGTTPAGADARRATEEGLRERIAWALRSTDALDRHRATLADRAGHLALSDVPDLQRVHGDYHLGQVLHSPSRGWVVLDFEGEPLRALHERTRPDLALRDVAGMLRSFDYAAGQVQVATDDAATAGAAAAWAADARDAFCRGYASVAGADPREHGELLTALELDKALYEVVYEAGNRPDWIDVPLHAVDRLVSTDRT